MKSFFQNRPQSLPPLPYTAVAVAMSGGVDSMTAAALLKKKGYAVRGFFMALDQPDLEQQIFRVRRAAEVLEIPLEVVELKEDFKKEVLDYFVHCYSIGKTPNPCIVCNRKIKFGRLLDLVINRGIGCLATGHYARILFDPASGYQLFRGADPKKDQSYFLCRLTQDRLAGIYFPLGEFSKEEVYELAAEFGLRGLHDAESQDICFLSGRGVRDFLAASMEDRMPGGPLVDLSGRRLGSHRGIHGFTVGQRRGLGIPDKSPYYVTELDPRTNEVIVGKEGDLWQNELAVREMNWISGTPPRLPQYFQVQIRYRHHAARALVTKEGGDMFAVRFSDAQRAVTPGQFAVLYKEDQVIGGGEIVFPRRNRRHARNTDSDRQG